MPKQSVLIAGIVFAGIAMCIEHDDWAAVLAQDNDRTVNAPAAGSNVDRNQTPDTTKPANEPKADAEIADEIVVTGIVLKPDGSPAPQATIRSMAPVPDQFETRLGRKLTPKMYQATTDIEGRFSISINKTPYGNPAGLEPRWQETWKTTPIVASLKGFGPACIEFEAINADQPTRLQLVDDHPIRGQIVDLEGTPVGGTIIRIRRVQVMQGENLDQVISIINEGRILIFFRQPGPVHRQFGLREVDSRLLGLPEEFRSDKEGRFAIHGLGKERLFHLALAGDDVASRSTLVMTRDMEAIQPKTGTRGATISEPVFGSNFKLVVSPSRAIEGTVVDAGTGEPLPGVAIQMSAFRSVENVREQADIVTDQSGHFRLTQMAKGARSHLLFVPADDQPYFPTDKNVSDSPGIEPVQLTVKLHRGLWIKGRVTDKVTHEPVPGIVVHYYPFKTNNRAEIVHIERSISRNREESPNKTDSEGMYRIVGVAGPGLVAAESLFGTYRTGVGFKELNMDNDEDQSQWPILPILLGPRINRTSAVRAINPTAEEKEVRLDFELDPGLKTRVRFVDAKGEPVKDTRAFGQGVRSPANSFEGTPDATATIENLGPDEKRILHAYHPDRELGARFEIAPPYDDNREITVRLEPLAIVTGHVLEDGEPIVGASIRRGYRHAGVHYSVFLTPDILTDSEGRFRVTLIPGNAWDLALHRRNQGPTRAFITNNLQVRDGETIDLGDLQLEKGRFKPVKKNVPPEKPEANDKSQKAPASDPALQPDKPSSNPKSD